MRLFFTTAILFFCAVMQTIAQKILRSTGNDSTAANRLIEYAAKIQFSYPSKAISTNESSIRLCTKINYQYGLSVAYSSRAGLLFYEMKLDSSKLLLDKSYIAVKDKRNKASSTQAATVLNRYAAIFNGGKILIRLWSITCVL